MIDLVHLLLLYHKSWEDGIVRMDLVWELLGGVGGDEGFFGF